MNTNQSSQPCGCDPGIDHQCENHKYAPLTREFALELLEYLYEIEGYLDNHADVIDGDYGGVKPNKAMSLLSTLNSKVDVMEKALKPNWLKNYVE